MTVYLTLSGQGLSTQQSSAAGKLRIDPDAVPEEDEEERTPITGDKITTDPVSGALARRLDNDADLTETALQNARDALLFTQSTASGLDDMIGILSYMDQLADISNSYLLDAPGRSAINNEYQLLGEELNRLKTESAFYNGTPLYSGQDISFHVSLSADPGTRAILASIGDDLESIDIGTGASFSGSISAIPDIMAQKSSIAEQTTTIEALRARVKGSQTGLEASVAAMQQQRSYLELATRETSAIATIEAAYKKAEDARSDILENAKTALNAHQSLNPVRVEDLLR